MERQTQVPPAAPRGDPPGGTGQRGCRGKVNTFLNKEGRQSLGIQEQRAGQPGSHLLSSPPHQSLSESEVLIKGTKYQGGPGAYVCSPSPYLQTSSLFVPELPLAPLPGAQPSQESSRPKVVPGRPGRCQGQPSYHPPTGFPPACSRRHTYLSCRIRLGLLPSEPDKGHWAGKDRDKDAGLGMAGGRWRQGSGEKVWSPRGPES